MRVLVVGGSGSGKSAWAEGLACQLSEKRTYIATMLPSGSEAERRIARHRQQRSGKGFRTLECPRSLASACQGAPGGVALLDDLGNLLANALFADDGSMEEPDTVLQRLTDELAKLDSHYEHLVLVGNEVGCEGRYGEAGTNAWVNLSGQLACRIAASFDQVYELVAGQACLVKGDTL